MDEEIAKLIVELCKINFTNVPDELVPELIKDLECYISKCGQKMTKLDGYSTLQSEIETLVNESKRFYIGYTAELGSYLWNTKPKSVEAKAVIESKKLVKSHTYYTHLDEKKTDEHEHALIKQFYDASQGQPRLCLNEKAFGKTVTDGIVYVLVYTPGNQ